MHDCAAVGQLNLLSRPITVSWRNGVESVVDNGRNEWLPVGYLGDVDVWP